jgi:thymidylate kinase
VNQLRGIILEGFSHAGKTSVLKSLKLMQAQDESAKRSVIVLSEHYSQVLHNMQGQMKRSSYEEHLQLLNDRVAMLRQLEEWSTKLGRASRGSRGVFFILERFHLNHRAAYSDKTTNEIEAIENELLYFGAKCALLTISPEIAEHRIQSRTPHEWVNKSSEEINAEVKELLTTQSELRVEATKSLIPTIEINTDSKDWDAYAREILRLLD